MNMFNCYFSALSGLCAWSHFPGRHGRRAALFNEHPWEDALTKKLHFTTGSRRNRSPLRYSIISAHPLLWNGVNPPSRSTEWMHECWGVQGRGQIYGGQVPRRWSWQRNHHVMTVIRHNSSIRTTFVKTNVNHFLLEELNWLLALGAQVTPQQIPHPISALVHVTLTCT